MSVWIELEPAAERFAAESSETVLAAAQRSGLALPHACQSGNCGACKATCRSGSTVALQPQNALTAAEQAAGAVLLCCVAAQSDAVFHMPGYAGRHTAPALTLPAKVRACRRHGGYAVLTLTLPKNRPWTFRAGQFLDILLPENRRRSYSIAGYDADARTVELHIRHRAGGVFSETVFSGSLKEGAVLRCQLPLGSFALNSGSLKPSIMLATGTGIAPIKAMLAELAATAPQHAVDVYWGMAHCADFYDLDALRAHVRALPHARLHTVVSRENGGDFRGYVQHAALAQHSDLADSEVYACGSADMINGAQELLCSHGLPETAFYADRFTPA